MKQWLVGIAVVLSLTAPSAAAEPEPCVGDCNGDGQVEISEIVTCVNIALGIASIEVCPDGDGDQDGHVEVHELVRSIGIALGISVPDQCGVRSCMDSGGSVAVGLCCRSVGNFPDTCEIGACSCPPESSHEVALCQCGGESCFDGSKCVSLSERGCLDSGGSVSTGLCCLSTGDFPDTCAIGACSCAPRDSHEVDVCDCGKDRCFNGIGMICEKSTGP